VEWVSGSGEGCGVCEGEVEGERKRVERGKKVEVRGRVRLGFGGRVCERERRCRKYRESNKVCSG